MNIKQISEEIHAVNVKNGFWEDKETKNMGETLMLVVTELAEALEAHRKGHYADMYKYRKLNFTPLSITFKENFETHIKNSFEDELADVIIRMLDLCEGFGIDIETHIRLKLEYNKTREYKHGKKY